MIVVVSIPTLASARLPGLPVTGFNAGGAGLTPFYLLGFELGPWQDYLSRELTPDFMLDPAAEPLNVSWMSDHSVIVLPFFAKQILGEPETYLRLEVDWNYSDQLAMDGFDPFMSYSSQGLERRLVSPGLMHRLNDSQLVGVSAVFATQSFGVSRLGMISYEQSIPANYRSALYDPFQETSYGAACLN